LFQASVLLRNVTEEELLRSLGGASTLFHLGAAFRPRFSWLAPAFATLQLSLHLVSYLPDSNSNLRT